MKVLVTGVKGQLGYDVCKVLSDRSVSWVGTDAADCDITDREAVEALFQRERPDGVIHCAAYTAVDKAEENEALAFAVNETGTRNIALACKALDAKLVYLSTDYVFPGVGEGFYAVEDETGPLNVYGRSKLAGELAVRELVEKRFIVRTSWVFGKNGSNFVRTMLRLAESREEVGVVCDQVGSPTYTADLAPLLCDMVESERYGVYHATNEGVCSWAEFAQAIFRTAGKKVTVKPLATKDYPVKAARPLNSRLDKGSLDAAGFARLPSWQDALKRYLKELEGEANA